MAGYEVFALGQPETTQPASLNFGKASSESDEEPASENEVVSENGGDDDDDDDDEFVLQGPEALDSEDDDDIEQLFPSKRLRPEHHFASNEAAARSAKRTQLSFSESFLLDEQDGSPAKIPAPASHVAGSSTRRKRAPKNALPGNKKRLTGEIGSDDDLMITMRENGYTDQQIVDRLAREGRMSYQRKSLSTRINRIKLAQAKNVDFLLAEGYKEWEFEDDVLLMQAYELANIEVNYEIERARAWRFQKVARYMRRLNKDAIFSEKACRERYIGLMDGTAAIPSALDDDPPARMMEMEAFRMAREAQREQEALAQEAQAETDRRIQDEAAIRQAEKAQATALSRQKKQQDRAERSMQRAAQNQIKLQRARENREAKAARLEQIRQQRAESRRKEAQRLRAANPNRRSATAHVVLKDLGRVTADTPDPRRWLSLDDLRTLCRERNLGAEGTTPEPLLVRLRDADDAWSLAHTKTLCRAKGMLTTGSKLALKYQLALAEARRFPSFEANLRAAEAEREDMGGADAVEDGEAE